MSRLVGSYRIIGYVALAIFLFSEGSMLLPFASATEGLREIKVDVSESKVVIESLKKTASLEDKLKVEFDAGSTWINLEYDTIVDGQPALATIKLEFFELIEFVDLNGDGVYDPDEPQEFVKKIGLDDLKPESLTRRDIIEEEIPGVLVDTTLTAPDKYEALAFHLTLHLFGGFVQFQGIPLEPTSMKVDIGVDGFPFSEESSKLALHSKVTIVAEDKLEESLEIGEELIAGRVGKWMVFFSWAREAEVDGGSTPVLFHIVEEKAIREVGKFDFVNELYLAYERGNSIFHDPRLGVSTLQLAAPVPLIPEPEPVAAEPELGVLPPLDGPEAVAQESESLAISSSALSLVTVALVVVVAIVLIYLAKRGK